MAAVIKSVTSLTSSPITLAAVLWGLTRAPESIREPLLAQLAKVLSPENGQRFISFLKGAFAFSLISSVNRRLNQYALNNWSWKSQKDKWTWNWEIAVVTGGCSGIGKETVKGLMRKGIKVAVLDVNPLPKELEGHTNVKYFHCDVTSPDSIHAAAKAVRECFGEPTILINNAGIGIPHPIVETSDASVEKIFKINIISQFILIREFLPYMVRKNKGHIVGIASMASYITSPGIVDYASTKAAVMALHEGLNQEIKFVYKTPGVLNTVVHPYWARTGLTRGFEGHLEKTQGKLMGPEVIANKVVAQVLSCQGGQIIIPRRMWTGSLVRGLPNWIQELLRDFFVGGAAAQFPKAQL